MPTAVKKKASNKYVLKQRMYFLVLYSLSDIQKGIQALHASHEYRMRFGKSKEFQQWDKDKTVILYNGGSTNQIGFDIYSEQSYTGTMDVSLIKLSEMKVPVRAFYEPDLNNAMTAIAFLVDERVWDKDKYPPLYPNARTQIEKEANKAQDIKLFGKQVAELKDFLKPFKFA